jgi:hypothetical protein
VAVAPLLSSAWTLPGSDRYGEGREQPKEGLLRRGGAVVGCRLRRSREVMGIRVGRPAEAGVHGQGGARARAHLTARVSMGAARHGPPLPVGHPQFLTVVIVLEFSIGARHTLCGLGCFYFHFGSMFCYLLYDLISSFWLEDLRLKFL